MEFNITNTQKQLALQTARRRLESEMYLLALLSGVDPDSVQSRLRDVLNVYETLLTKL